MKKPIRTLCSYMSDNETDVFIGSAYCKYHCPHFNGTVNKKEISCLIPKM